LPEVEGAKTQYRAELTLMHSPLIQGTFPAVNSTWVAR